MAETTIAFLKTEALGQLSSNVDEIAVERAVLNWTDGFNNRRFHRALGYTPPAECERDYYQKQSTPNKVSRLR